jgi:hypothetical protein
MIAALEYTNPDKIPVYYQASQAGLHVHGEKLASLMTRLSPDNYFVPQIQSPPSSAKAPDGSYHEIKTDEWGTAWEYRIFGVAGHPKDYPMKSWDDSNFSFPHVYSCSPQKDRNQVAFEKQNFLVTRGWVSIFERLHALRPIDELLMDIASEDESLLEFIQRLVDWQEGMVDHLLDCGADIIQFGDDWGTQNSTLTSPSFFRKVYRPHYERLFSRIHARKARVLLHCCGQISGIIDDFLDLGADILWLQCQCYDFNTMTAKFKSSKATWLYHPDRQRLVPNGTPDEIRQNIRQVCFDFHKLGGGGIFNVEIENDAPFENIEALIEAIHQYR